MSPAGWGLVVAAILLGVAVGIVIGCALAASYELRQDAMRVRASAQRVDPRTVVVMPASMADREAHYLAGHVAVGD